MLKIKYSTNFHALNENTIEAKYFDIIFCSSKQYALKQSKQNKDVLFARKNTFYLNGKEIKCIDTGDIYNYPEDRIYRFEV